MPRDTIASLKKTIEEKDARISSLTTMKDAAKDDLEKLIDVILERPTRSFALRGEHALESAISEVRRFRDMEVRRRGERDGIVEATKQERDRVWTLLRSLVGDKTLEKELANPMPCGRCEGCHNGRPCERVPRIGGFPG